VQHGDKDVRFQERILKAMKAELPKRNADPKNFAYLTDRVLLKTFCRIVMGTISSKATGNRPISAGLYTSGSV